MNKNQLSFKPCGLPKNACASKKCRFYLIPKTKIGRHFDIWGKKLPF